MELICTKICKASDIGVNNNLFGGTMMAWLDEAGATMACEKCSTPMMVTLKINEVVFKKPVKVGQHIKIYGDIKRIGNTSITLYIEARHFDFDTGGEDPVVSTETVFVKIDNEGHSIPIKV